jgi:hypothetical protein
VPKANLLSASTEDHVSRSSLDMDDHRDQCAEVTL